MRKHVLITLGAVAMLALAIASTAGADPPTRSYVPAAPFSGPFCPTFDVGLTPLINREYQIVFSNGATITTGSYIWQLTNLSTGKSIVVNASGPGFNSADGNTLTLRGLTLITFPADFPYPGAPATTHILSGLGVADFSTGSLVFTETGHIRDLCAELS